MIYKIVSFVFKKCVIVFGYRVVGFILKNMYELLFLVYVNVERIVKCCIVLYNIWN